MKNIQCKISNEKYPMKNSPRRLFIGHWKFDIGYFTFFSLQTPTGPPAGGRCQVFAKYLKKVSPFAKVKPLKTHLM